MRYMKYVVSDGENQCEEVKAFKNSEFPEEKTWEVDGLKIVGIECDYKEKYKIHRRGITPFHEIIRRL